MSRSQLRISCAWHSGCLSTCSWWHLTAHHCLASCHFHLCHSEMGTVPPVPLGSTHQNDTSSKHPAQQRQLSHGNPCSPSNPPAGTSTPLQPDFPLHLPQKNQLNHLLVSLLNLTKVTLLESRRPQLNSRGAVFVGVTFRGPWEYFFLVCCIIPHSPKHLCG